MQDKEKKEKEKRLGQIEETGGWEGGERDR